MSFMTVHRWGKGKVTLCLDDNTVTLRRTIFGWSVVGQQGDPEILWRMQRQWLQSEQQDTQTGSPSAAYRKIWQP